jgi:hypothetical protein
VIAADRREKTIDETVTRRRTIVAVVDTIATVVIGRGEVVSGIVVRGWPVLVATTGARGQSQQ